ncbi:unnamed protein product [Rotaria sp. Silwood1]|nr:unnamed protein product [Rotaria sp. Silwood1]
MLMGQSQFFFDVISEWIFQEKLIRFVNLKSIILSRYYLTETLINNLSLLVQYQLDELILKIDKDTFEMFYYTQKSWINNLKEVRKFTTICNHFIRQLFSSKCQLTSLQLDISKDNSVFQIHNCLSSSSDIISNPIDNQLVTKCMTLRRLHVHLFFGSFIEHIIEHVPNLEILSVIFRDSLASEFVHQMKIEKFTSTVISWYDKVK